MRVEHCSTSTDETLALGVALGAVLEAGDFIVLEGELGAGKTRFAEGIARGLGIATRIPSPTFSLVHEHVGRVPLVHADFYRLRSAAELFALGWTDYLARPAVLVVEWLSNIGAHAALAPSDRIAIDIAIVEQSRRIRIHANGPVAASRLAACSGAMLAK